MPCRPLPSSFSARFAVWLFACALLLKAAVPVLASASAEAQGKAVAEVCTVYGVKTVALGGEPAPDHAPDHALPHAGDHCALSAAMALAAPQPAAIATVPPDISPLLPPPQRQVAAPDASARWQARLKQGPPARV